MPLIMQYKTGAGTPITEWVDNTFWTSSQLTWNGTGWDYDGDYGGCDACGRSLTSTGTWAAGFRPTSMQLTFTVHQVAPVDNGYIQMQDTGFNYIIAYTPITGILPIGTYVKSFSLDFSNNLDIQTMYLFLGECTGAGCVDQDRPWTLTSIVFS